MALMNSSAFRNLKVDDCVGCKVKLSTYIDLAHLISPLSGFCPLSSTDVAISCIVIGATADKHLSALVEYYPC